MNNAQLDEFLEWYKGTREFDKVPDEDKPMHLARIIKDLQNIQITSNNDV